MAKLTDIRVGLAAALGAIEGIQASPYMLSNPTPPAAHVFPDRTQYHQAMGNGAETWGLIVQVFVGIASERGAQERLDRMLASNGSESIKAALESDQTLGGLVAGVTVTETSGYRTYHRGQIEPVLGAEWLVSVFV